MNAPQSRLFALIPAAGHSRRMGRPKLLLPFGDSTLIARLLAALDRDDIAERIVVLRRDDEQLRAAVEVAGASALQPTVDPPDMRASVECGLAEIERRHAPAGRDGWILIPADHPLLVDSVLETLIAEWSRRDCEILVPTYRGRRGHPTIFRWNLVAAVRALPHDCGLNRLLDGRAADVCQIAIDHPSVVADIDTPEDYEKLRKQAGDGPT
jgi:molybdenum cofactor cytidylyltransferase